MKSLGSNSTTAVDGVLIVLVTLWMQECHIDLTEEAVKSAKSVSPGMFNSFTDFSLGRVLMDHSDMYKRFHSWVTENPQVKAILKMVSPHLTMGNPQGVRFNGYFHSDIGAALKKSDWWKDHKDEIDKIRRDTKKVGQVMES